MSPYTTGETVAFEDYCVTNTPFFCEGYAAECEVDVLFFLLSRYMRKCLLCVCGTRRSRGVWGEWGFLFSFFETFHSLYLCVGAPPGIRHETCQQLLAAALRETYVPAPDGESDRAQTSSLQMRAKPHKRGLIDFTLFLFTPLAFSRGRWC